jgi:hypothetical protein
MKEDEIDGACSTHGRQRNAWKFLLENIKERDHLEKLGVDGTILEWISNS